MVLVSTTKVGRKKEIKPKESRKIKIIKISLEINKIEKITKVKIWFFERLIKLINSK